jgi:hypothetical protein
VSVPAFALMGTVVVAALGTLALVRWLPETAGRALDAAGAVPAGSTR